MAVARGGGAARTAREANSGWLADQPRDADELVGGGGPGDARFALRRDTAPRLRAPQLRRARVARTGDPGCAGQGARGADGGGGRHGPEG